MTVAQPSLPDFLDTYPDKVRRYKDLLAAQDPEHTPYKSSYEAAQLQSDLAQQCQQATAGSTNADAPTTVIPNTDVHAPTLLGRIGVRRGIALAGTDLRQDALEALQRGMKHLRQQQPCEDLLSLINALNALGALHCALDQLRDGAEQLRAAEAAFHASQGDAAALRGSQQLLQLEGERGEGAARVLEDAHTTTVHYLAQVYQNMGEAAQAAEYCALTLQRQSEALGALCALWFLGAALPCRRAAPMPRLACVAGPGPCMICRLHCCKGLVLNVTIALPAAVLA